MEVVTAVLSIVVAVALGFLEAAWTYPDRGGPHNIRWGVTAILVVLLIVTWPYIWWIPALAIVEELAHLYSTGGHLTRGRVLRHWSVDYVGVNIYPYITFPALTVLVEIIYHLLL